MSPIPPPDQIVAVAFLVALFYGLYLATFFHCMRWLLFTDEGWELRGLKSVQWPIFLITLAIFIMSTLDRGLQLRRWTEQATWYPSPVHPQTHTTDWIDVVLVRLALVSWTMSCSNIFFLKCTTANLTSQLADSVLVCLRYHAIEPFYSWTVH